MALLSKSFFRNCRFLTNTTKPVNCYLANNYSLKFISHGICPKSSFNSSLRHPKQLNFIPICSRTYSAQTTNSAETPDSEPKKLGLLQRFRQMYRDYWYVLVPVHVATSAIWFGSFYYAVRSGVDVISLLQSLNVSEKLIAPLKDSSAGYFALAFALYKVAAPLRYAVTIGGTTFAINKLTVLGWIKPVPSKERLKEILQEKKENLQDRIAESQTQMKDKGTHIMEEMKRYKSEISNRKTKQM